MTLCLCSLTTERKLYICVAERRWDWGRGGASGSRLQVATTGQFGLTGATIDYAGPSIGMIVATPEARDIEALLAQADAVMYADKRLRKGSGARLVVA